MLTQHPLQKKILIDVQRRVLAGAGQQMYYGIKDIALRIPLDQIKFAAAFFNGNKAPVIGHIGQQPGHDRGFAGAGGAGNADGHPISDTGSQKVKHFSSGTAGVQQFFFTDGLLVDNTDGGIDAYIRIHNGSFIHRNTDVLVQKSHNAGHGVINDHAAGVEHPADHIDGVLGRTEFIRDLDATPTGFDHFNVVVGVDVDLLNTGLIDPFLQKGVAGHVFIELGTQFFCREPVKGIFAFDNVVFHQFFQQFFFTDGLLVDNTDGGIDAYIRIHNGSFIHRNTDVLVQKSHNAGHGVINDHAAGVEHPADHIDGVLGRTEFIRDLDATPTGFDHFNVVVGVDVDLLNTGLIDPFLQKGVAGHVFIELGTQFFCREPVKGILSLDNVVFHQFFEQTCGTLCIAFPSFGNGGGMFFGKIPLYIL